MKFEKLSKKNLFKLKEDGYNLLIYNKEVSELCITWFPETKDNIYEYVANLCSNGDIIFDKPNILILDEGIVNVSDKDLIGDVFVGGYS